MKKIFLFLTLFLSVAAIFFSCKKENKDENGFLPAGQPGINPPIADQPLSVAGGGQDVKYPFTLLTPKVITPESGDSVYLEVRNENISSEYPEFKTAWGPTVTLNDKGVNGDKVAGDKIFTVKLNKQNILNVNIPGRYNRPFIGTIDFGAAGYLSVFGEVWNASIPLLEPRVLSDEVQMTSNLVNIRAENISLDNRIQYIQTFYKNFGDDYDFICLIFPGFNLNRHYIQLKQTVEGIGLSPFDNTAQYGSGGRLSGYCTFPNTRYFDGASVAYMHEMGHHWINFLWGGPFSSGIPHWPLSDLANGIMGYSPGGGQGLSFPFELNQQSANTWKLEPKTTPTVYSDLELYLMGLLPPAEVKPHIVFEDQSQQVQPGAILSGPVFTVTIGDIIGKYGERLPSHANSPKSFRVATVIVSNKLLNSKEMSFYSYYASRAAWTQETIVAEGYSVYTSKPFFLATGGRGSLNVSIVK